MLPFLIVPLALALGLSTHAANRAPSPAAVAATDSTAPKAKQPPKEPVTIQFENRAWELATVYAVPDHGLPIRLGDVTAGSTARLVVPRSVVASATTINVVARRLAVRGTFASGPITVLPGDALSASLTSNGLVSVLPGR